MRFYVHSLVNSWWFILMISSFTASRMMNILSICVLFLMSCARHVCSVTLRSAPFAPIECLFLVMLLHRRALRWMRQRLLPSRAGHFRLRSRRFEVFLVLQVSTGVSCGISAPLQHLSMSRQRMECHFDGDQRNNKLWMPSSRNSHKHRCYNFQILTRLSSLSAMRVA